MKFFASNTGVGRLARGLVLLGACTLPLVGCDKKDDAATSAAGATKVEKTALKVSPLLAHVPADSPYVFANFDPMPRAFMDKMFTKIGPVFEQATKKIQDELAKPPVEGEVPSDDQKVVRALLDELNGKLSSKGLEELGLTLEPLMAIYGVGFVPVMRLTLKDGAAIKALVSRVEAKAGVKAPTAKLGDVEYWTGGDGDVYVAIALIGNELVVSAGPMKVKDLVLPVAFGVEKVPSMADGALLTDINKQYGFAGFGTGYIDGVAISNILMGEGTGLNKKIFDALAVKAADGTGGVPELSVDCKTEIKGMVANFPRVVLGYDSFTATEMALSLTLESKTELARELAALRSNVPGLTNAPSMPFAFIMGLAIDVEKTMAFVTQKAQAISTTPYKCEHLSGLNEGANGAIAALTTMPIPPFVKMLKGLSIVLKDAKIDMSKGPEGIESAIGYALISATAPEQLLATAKAMVPPLASLTVPSDSKPVALTLPPEMPLPPFIKAPHVALSKDAIIVTVGEGMQAEATAILSAPPGADQPLFVIGYDIGKLLQSQIANAAPDGTTPEKQAELETMKSISDFLGSVTVSLHLNEKGIAFKERATFR